jgi:hypothetical protein
MVCMSRGEEGECLDEWILNRLPLPAGMYKYGPWLKRSIDLPHELALPIRKLIDFV